MQVPKVKTFPPEALLFRQGTRVSTPAFVAGLRKTESRDAAGPRENPPVILAPLRSVIAQTSLSAQALPCEGISLFRKATEG